MDKDVKKIDSIIGIREKALDKIKNLLDKFDFNNYKSLDILENLDFEYDVPMSDIDTLTRDLNKAEKIKHSINQILCEMKQEIFDALMENEVR